MNNPTLASILALLFFAPSPLLAQPQKIAEKVQKAYEKTQDLQMDFIQETYVALLEKKVKRNGKVQFKKPGKFYIQYEGSKGKFYRSNGQKLWVGRKGDPEVQTQNLDPDTVPAEALSFLGGLGNLKKDFAVESVDSKKWEHFGREPGKLQWLELTPLKKQSQIEWLVMGYDPQNFLAEEVYIHTDSGNLSHYRFKNLKENQGLADSLFHQPK